MQEFAAAQEPVVNHFNGVQTGKNNDVPAAPACRRFVCGVFTSNQNEGLFVGRTYLDGRKALARVIIRYLDLLSHSVLFIWGGYLPAAYRCVRYGQVLLQKCKRKEILDYFDNCLRTAYRWLKYSKLRKFSAAIVDEKGRYVVNYTVEISSARFALIKRINNFEDRLARLERRFEHTLSLIQSEGMLQSPVNEKRRVRIVLRTQIAKHTAIRRKRPMEFVWKQQRMHCRVKTTEPVGKPVESALVKMTVLCTRWDFSQ